MKIKGLLLNKEKKTTTLITEEEITQMDFMESILTGKPLPKKTKAIVLKCHEEDEYDPYVGAALALAEATFGSKRQFRMWVDNQSKKAKTKEDKKEEKSKRIQKTLEKQKKEKTKSKKILNENI